MPVLSGSVAEILEGRSRQIRVLYVMRVAFVLRSIEVHPRLNDLVSAILKKTYRLSILGLYSDTSQ